jgi:hypothetical protein
MNSELRNLTVGRTDNEQRAGIGFDAKRVLAAQRRGDC